MDFGFVNESHGLGRATLPNKTYADLRAVEVCLAVNAVATSIKAQCDYHAWHWDWCCRASRALARGKYAPLKSELAEQLNPVKELRLAMEAAWRTR